MSVTVRWTFLQKPDFEFEVDRMPLPSYPKEMMRRGLSGEATVEFALPTSGVPTGVQLINATLPQFGEASLAAVKSWRFAVGYRVGKKPGRIRSICMFLFTEKPNQLLEATPGTRPPASPDPSSGAPQR